MLESLQISFFLSVIRAENRVGWGKRMKRLITLFCIAGLLAILGACGSSGGNTSSPHRSDALFIAVRQGKPDTVKILLEARDVDVNANDGNGNTPIIEAARFGHDAVTRMLLTAGANPNVRDANGKTPLMLAVMGGHDDVVRVLKEAGVKE